MDRAAALARYRMGAPLPFEELRFARRDSAGAVRVGVLGARGSPESTAAARPPVAEVERSVRVGAFRRLFDAGNVGGRATARGEVDRRMKLVTVIKRVQNSTRCVGVADSVCRV